MKIKYNIDPGADISQAQAALIVEVTNMLTDKMHAYLNANSEVGINIEVYLNVLLNFFSNNFLIFLMNTVKDNDLSRKEVIGEVINKAEFMIQDKLARLLKEQKVNKGIH